MGSVTAADFPGGRALRNSVDYFIQASREPIMTLSVDSYIKALTRGRGEVQELRAHTVLALDPSSVPSTRVGYIPTYTNTHGHRYRGVLVEVRGRFSSTT